MDTLRLFIAINFTEQVKQSIAGLQTNLKIGSSGVKWVEPENFHLTLKFLGDTNKGKISDVEQILSEIAAQNHSFNINLQGMGVFPNARNPKIIWLGIKGQLEKLKALHSSIDLQLSTIGFPKDDRIFSPHLTLGRLRNGATSQLNEQLKIHRNTTIKSAEITVAHVSLMMSELIRQGPVYSELVKFHLKQ